MQPRRRQQGKNLGFLPNPLSLLRKIFIYQDPTLRVVSLNDNSAARVGGPRDAAVPFLKWAGGKSVIADAIIRRIGQLPATATYFEPFLGGGAVFFRLRPKRAILSDSNPALVATYLEVMQRPGSVVAELESLGSPKSGEDYGRRRDEFNELLPALTDAETPRNSRLAALFIWLNHTCYNGLYRVNRAGQFNVPYGQYEQAFIYDRENLLTASAALRGAAAELLCGDYASVVQRALPGDVLYFDPPYQPLDETSNFTAYTATGFNVDEQALLAKYVFRLIERGCRVVVSNSPTPEIHQLYRGLRTEELLVPRAINCVGTKRQRVPELLIYPRGRMTLHDQWNRVVADCHFDLDGAQTFEVTSARVKRITGEEPRLVAKMDTREDLPLALSSKGYFVLPVAATKYALVPGDGYHNLEDLDLTPRLFQPKQEVPVTVALHAGESAAIQTALYTGLLERVVGIPQLRQTLHNDRVSLKGVRVSYGNAWTLPIDGARVEVDAGFENHEEFFVFECKAWKHSEISNFNIRQLFYPQLRALQELRELGLSWGIRCFFLNVEPDIQVFRFWEYTFSNPFDLSSIQHERSSAFALKPAPPRAFSRLLRDLSASEEVDTDYVPQANDASKLLTLIQGVAEGYQRPSEVARRFRFDPRQSSYYAEAAEQLGLLVRDRRQGYALTEQGRQVAASTTDVATRLVIERIFTLPVFRRIAESAIDAGSPTVYRDQLPQFVRRAAGQRYNETTVHRRAQSVAAWLNWIGEATGTVQALPRPKVPARKRTLDSY